MFFIATSNLSLQRSVSDIVVQYFNSVIIIVNTTFLKIIYLKQRRTIFLLRARY